MLTNFVSLKLFKKHFISFMCIMISFISCSGFDGSFVTGNFVKVISARYSVCALTSNGDVYCWGYNGSHEVSSSDKDSVFRPVKVPLPGPSVSVKTGSYSSCSILKKYIVGVQIIMEYWIPRILHLNFHILAKYCQISLF